MALLTTLGIETSCDETAVAVIDGDGRVVVDLLASQADRHAPYGGVVPELASREHLVALPRLVARALAETPARPELVAVTGGPGLIGALLVGVRFAAAFAWARGLPLVSVDHLEGHLASPFLDLAGGPAVELPGTALALVASGGHSSWYLMEDRGARRLCRTRDDAAGESLDKVAQLLGLPYPGGPEVDRLARTGTPGSVDLPRPRLRDSRLDLSFSGLKSAAVRWIRQHGLEGAGASDPPPAEVVDLLASFEAAVVETLMAPLEELTDRHRPVLLTASGGVAANTLLRRRMGEAGAGSGIPVRLPPRPLTTDNAAMIARAGQLAHARGERHDPRRIDARARQSWQPPGMRRLSQSLENV
jgi:N6-L-threonylcarbamoyladenine synthase